MTHYPTLRMWGGFCLLVAGLLSCREDIPVFVPEVEQLTSEDSSFIYGFYLLNEGNMGSNKATLDYYDFTTGEYHRNIYGSANPTVPKELGDVGNDIKIYGSRLYAVINCSRKVEVMDARTAVRIGQIDIPNCRYICFQGQYAYISSYAGPVQINPNYEQRGYVAKVDTATLEILDRCLVGFQPDELTIDPDELTIIGDKLYVVNSGGYMAPNYENTVSVIDLHSFTETHRIPVAINLHHICADRHGKLWVSSRGDYFDIPSKLYCIDTRTELIDSLDIAVSNFWLDGDSLYIYSSEWSNITMGNEITYGIVDVARRQIVTRQFITDDIRIHSPYGIMVHPQTKNIYLTDAKDYVSPGTLYCFSPQGTLLWEVTAGDIPAHFALHFRLLTDSTTSTQE